MLPIVPRRALVRPLVLVALVVLPGCRDLFSPDDHLALRTPLDRLRTIDRMELAGRSQSPPVSVEAATAELVSSVLNVDPDAETLSIDLARVRAAALANNLDLQVQLIDPAIAASTVDEEEAKFEATFTGSARLTQTESPTEFATQSSSSDIRSLDLGVRIPLRNGTTARVDIPFSRSATNNQFSLLNPAYGQDVRFSVSQPLLRNAGTRVNAHSIRVARYQQQITDARTKLEAIRILANADRAYWRLFAANRELEVRQQEYELAVEQLGTAERKFTAGDVPEIEVTRAQSGLASRLEAIIIAETLVRTRQRELKRIMNDGALPISSDIRLAVATEPDPVGLDLSAEALCEEAIANRMEMLELELQIAQDASTIDFQRNQALPLVTLDYSYALGGLSTSRRRAWDQIEASTFDTWSIGLGAEVPIGNQAARARVHQAVLTRLQRLATRELRAQSIRQEVLDALDRLDQDWQRILAARQAAILAGRTLEAERRQFDQGLRTSTDVLDAATQLADAQSAEIQALADYQIAQVDIAFATGTLLGHGRVRWDAVAE